MTNSSHPAPSIAQSDSEPPSGVRRASAAISLLHVSTADIDEAALAFGHLYPGAVLETLPGATFGCELVVAAVGAVSFLTGTWPGGARVNARALGDKYVLALGAAGGCAITQGGRAALVAPERSAAMGIPGRSVVARIEPGFQGRSVVIDRAALEGHLAILTGRVPRGPIVFDVAVNLEESRCASILGVVHLLRTEMERPGVSALLLAGLRDALLTGLLVGLRHEGSSRLAATPTRVAPACVRRAEEIIAARAAEPITLADIVAATGTPARSLQAAFRASRDMTPMEFLRERRMDLARRRLLAGAPETTVAGVAAALGFSHLGRFRAEYRRRFGESSTVTLARGRASAGSDGVHWGEAR